MLYNPFSLKDKTILITGASSGIGRATAVECSKLGANVIITGRNKERLQATFDMLDTTGNHVQILGDLTLSEDIARIISSIPQIDGLVNNAGVSIPRLLVDADSKYELDDTVFDKTMDVNVKGAFHCAQACAKSMLRQHHGVILNISSECGKEGSLAQSVYSASKAAIESLTRSWAKELSPQGIRVVAIAPGPMEATALFSASYIDAMCHCRHIQPEAIGTTYHAATLMGREGHLEEIANTVLFLASDRASFITGTTINVSGGKSR